MPHSWSRAVQYLKLVPEINAAAAQGNVAPRDAWRTHVRPAVLEQAETWSLTATGYFIEYRDRLASVNVALGLTPAVTPPTWRLPLERAVLRRARLLDGEPPSDFPLTLFECLQFIGLANFNDALQRIPAAAPGAELTAIRAEMTTEALRWIAVVAAAYEGFHIERARWLATLRYQLGVTAVPPEAMIERAVADLRATALID